MIKSKTVGMEDQVASVWCLGIAHKIVAGEFHRVGSRGISKLRWVYEKMDLRITGDN